jgi:glycerate 2-kinase
VAVIKNREQLAGQGDVLARKVVLEIAEATLGALNAYRVVRDLLVVDGDTLRIGRRRWPLSGRRVFVVGAGKAANAMAKAVDDALGAHIRQGLAIVKTLEPSDRLRRIELVEGGHPLPNLAGHEATRRILALADQAGPDDVFLSVISGGSSALMSCPLPGISLADERAVTEALLRSSARILEINAVRRHISAVNGGRLAQRIAARGAELINLIISDSVGKRPTADPAEPTDFVGTPVAPDGTTLDDAREVLARFGLLSRVPLSIVEFLMHAGPDQETPKRLPDHVHHFVVQRPADACEAAQRAAAEMGLSVCILSTQLEGESRQAGTLLAGVAKEAALNRRPLVPPGVLIAGGETTTTVEGPCGLGGPSQELALSFALEIAGRRGLALCALDTDGTDGPTDVAGGLVDGGTVERARQVGLDPRRSLAAHDSSSLLSTLGDTIITGNTGTNLCDLNLVYVADVGD